MNKSLLIGLLILTSAARASAQPIPAGAPYSWVLQDTTTTVLPLNAVRAPAVNAVSMAACFGYENSTVGWVGFVAGRANCAAGNGAGGVATATIKVRVLTVPKGSSARWVPLADTLPTNRINGGANYATGSMVVCAVGGYVGYVKNNSCVVGKVPVPASSATVLTW